MFKMHEVKCWPEFYDPLADGRKPFEVRFNDRDYQVGDLLHVREWSVDRLTEASCARTCDGDGFTGRNTWRKVTYVLPLDKGIFKDFCMPNYVALGLVPCNEDGQELRPVVRILAPDSVVIDLDVRHVLPLAFRGKRDE